jgi:Tfp pilus assembly protein PilO
MNSIRDLIKPGISKAMGFYLILILALVRFMVYPLHDAVAEKKLIFGELSEMHQLRGKQFSRQTQDQANKPLNAPMSKEQIALHLYGKAMSFPSIQADMLRRIMTVAETKRLTVQNFEMLEPVTGKTVSEVPVLIRVSGKPEDLIDVLSTVGSGGKTVLVKSMEWNKSNKEMLLALTLATFRMEK